MITNDIRNFLDAINLTPADRVQMLVAADAAQEAGEDSLSELLREIAKPDCRDILPTGSRVYGSPGPDSDWDWVILLPYLPHRLRSAADTCRESDEEYRGVKGIDAALRFGPVNLLVVTTRDQFFAWEEGTRLLCAEREKFGPVRRERAVEVFQAKFAFEGLDEPTGLYK